MLSEAEVEKNNRLALMVAIHNKRQQLQHKQSEEIMEQQAAVTEKETYICQQCGRDGLSKLYTSHGRQVCSSCQTMRGMIQNKPDIALAAIQELRGDLLHGTHTEVTYNGFTGPELAGYMDRLEEVMARAYPQCDRASEKYWDDLDALPDLVQRIRGAFELHPEDNLEAIIEQAGNLGAAVELAQCNCNDLTTANREHRLKLQEYAQQLHALKLENELLAEKNTTLNAEKDELLQQMTAGSGAVVDIVEQIDIAMERELLNLALASLRGDGATAADIIEGMRGGEQCC